MKFRFLKHNNYDAATNMAVDEAILDAHLTGHVPPTLRLYTFSPPAVSLGYAQKISSKLYSKIKAKGINVVRRPTGGRAVLHMGDLTYSFICSTKGAFQKEYIVVNESIALAYKQICQALILALDLLDIKTALGHGQNNYRDKHDCFMAVTTADLLYAGKKIAGSAQLRRKHAVLQHGSLILNQPQFLMSELFENGDANKVNRHINLYDINKKNYSIELLENVLVKGFEQAFNNQFESGELCPIEKELVQAGMRKYNTNDFLSA